MKQVTANVYAEDQFSVPPKYRGCNPSFVTTSEGIVMIDTPMMPTDAIKWRKEIHKFGEVRYIINTDHHVDHTTGNFFFPGTVISHERTREIFTAPAGQKIIKPGQRTLEYVRELIKKYDPEGASLLEKDYQPKAPTITFSDRLSLCVGEQTFELIYLPGHTQCNIGIYMLPDKVFFSGDNFTNKTQPSLANSVPMEWVKALRRIEALDIDVVVPGHGEVSGKGEIQRFRLFIQQCIDMVREAIKQGMSEEEAASKISFEELYPGDQSNLAVHPGAEQQRRNVLQLYEMLSK
ncbi:MBL fold metallo-hydrolase [Chloroflexota bacterium]